MTTFVGGRTLRVGGTEEKRVRECQKEDGTTGEEDLEEKIENER